MQDAEKLKRDAANGTASLPIIGNRFIFFVDFTTTHTSLHVNMTAWREVKQQRCSFLNNQQSFIAIDYYLNDPLRQLARDKSVPERDVREFRMWFDQFLRSQSLSVLHRNTAPDSAPFPRVSGPLSG